MVQSWINYVFLKCDQIYCLKNIHKVIIIFGWKSPSHFHINVMLLEAIYKLLVILWLHFSPLVLTESAKFNILIYHTVLHYIPLYCTVFIYLIHHCIAILLIKNIVVLYMRVFCVYNFDISCLILNLYPPVSYLTLYLLPLSVPAFAIICPLWCVTLVSSYP